MKGKPILSILGYGLLAVLLFLLLVAACERKLIYFPLKYPEGYWHSNEYGLSAEDVYFKAKDGVRLHGWWIPHNKAVATLLWFHGNAGNITHRIDNIARLQKLSINIFIFDYRGYGRSEGRPGEQGLSLDSQAAYEVIVKEKNIDPKTLVLFGRSLGGVFAIQVAAKNEAAGLILESTFTSAQDMAGIMFPFLPVGKLIRSKFDSLEAIKNVTVPKLFLHGTQDTIVPYELGRKLFHSAREPKSFYDIKSADHNDTYNVGGPSYFQALDRFIRRVVKAE